MRSVGRAGRICVSCAIVNPLCGSKYMSTAAPQPFAMLRLVPEVRAWRRKALSESQKVGFVATMGALHDGHLDLVRHSLEECDATVVSIFVNPAQFAPHEDLKRYPRPLEHDIAKLAAVSNGSRRVSALFLPEVETLYPSGIRQDVADQIGTFVDVKGFSHQMEGGSRPTFFRGVATVVTKLFNIVQPDRTYFGQKDIQQCMVLRQMLRDLYLPYPPSPADLVVVPTSREEPSGLAMSSRNAYLTQDDRRFAPLLVRGLRAAAGVYEQQQSSGAADDVEAEPLLELARQTILEGSQYAPAGRVRIDYIALNDPRTLEPLRFIRRERGALLSGALWVGSTRLIDNLLLVDTLPA